MESLEDRLAPNATPILFTIAQAQSQLTLSGTVSDSGFSGPIMAQGPGSLTSAISGTINTSWDPATQSFAFLGSGTALDANNSGSWIPAHGGGTGTNAQADYGGQANIDIGGFFSVAAYMAVRGLVVSIPASTAQPLSSAGAGSYTVPQAVTSFTIPMGTADYAASGVTAGNINLATSSSAQNQSGGTFTDNGGGSYTLNIPVSFSVMESGGGVSATFNVNGTIVATATIPTTTPPVVSSSVATDANPTNARIVHFTVTFNEAVTGVGTSAFAVATTNGVVGAVASVTPVSSSVYTVAVNLGTISSPGTAQLQLVQTAGIQNSGGQTLSGPFTTGQAYTTDAANFDELGAYRPSNGSWSLDSNGQFGFQNGAPPVGDRVMSSFSPAGTSVIPVSGDWTGTGSSKIGDFLNGTWHLDLNDNGIPDPGETFSFGTTGDVPVPGTYLPGGGIELAVFRSVPSQGYGEFVISDPNWLAEAQAGQPIGISTSFIFGAAGDRVVVGDWNGAGLTEVGVFRSAAAFGNPNAAVFSLDVANHHAFDSSNQVFIFGTITDGVVIGDWDGSGTSKVGVYRPATAFGAPNTAVFSLDEHGDLDFTKDGQVFLFGLPTDKYVTGRWAFTTSTAPAQTPGAADNASLAAALAGPGTHDPTALDAFFTGS